jgi:hypothetical protein
MAAGELVVGDGVQCSDQGDPLLEVDARKALDLLPEQAD